MRRKIISVVVFLIAMFAVPAAAEADENQAIKKTKSGICRCPGGQYYARTKNFIAYPTIKACLDSGGR